MSVVALALAWTGSPGTAALALLALAVLAAVHHAEVVAHRVGEPFPQGDAMRRCAPYELDPALPTPTAPEAANPAPMRG